MEDLEGGVMWRDLESEVDEIERLPRFHCILEELEDLNLERIDELMSNMTRLSDIELR